MCNMQMQNESFSMQVYYNIYTTQQYHLPRPATRSKRRNKALYTLVSTSEHSHSIKFHIFPPILLFLIKNLRDIHALLKLFQPIILCLCIWRGQVWERSYSFIIINVQLCMFAIKNTIHVYHENFLIKNQSNDQLQ